MIVEKIIPRNMIINHGCASVDNHIPRDDIFDYHPLKNVILYKYNILERVIVENIIPRNMIITLGCASVDNHISRDDFFDHHPLKNVIFILF